MMELLECLIMKIQFILNLILNKEKLKMKKMDREMLIMVMDQDQINMGIFMGIMICGNLQFMQHNMKTNVPFV